MNEESQSTGEKRLEEIEALMATPDFWLDKENAQKLVREYQDIKEAAEGGPGDFMTAAPGHDAWVLGDESCVLVDWQGMADSATR